jgi:hypothetical protein
VRVLGRPAFRARDLDLAQHFHRPLPGFRAGQSLVQADSFRDLLADPEHRVQGRHGFLKNHGDLAPADGANGVRVQLQKVAAFEENTAFDDSRRASQQP